MAYTAINKATANFNTNLWLGNTSGQTISGVGFKPDLNWSKCRSNGYAHQLIDSVRGITKQLNSNDAAAEGTNANGITAFNSDGYSIGTQPEFSNNGNTFAGWSWKAGTTGSGNTGGSGTYKAYSYSVNTTAGFSIVKYIGNGTGGHTIPHHLGVAPSNVIIKDISASNSWICKMQGYDGYLYLNNTNAGTSNSTWLPTDANNLTLANTWGAYNTNGATYIAYCFSEKQGYSKFGGYTGNGSTDGTFVYTGFKPAFVMVKRTNNANNWVMIDNKRDPFNLSTKYLLANDAAVEGTGLNFDLLSNGFKLKSNSGGTNTSTATYIYMAIGQSVVGTNNVPCTAR